MEREQTGGVEVREGHLGGCYIGGDQGTYYPTMWRYILEKYSPKTVVDIGCGVGHSTLFFHEEGCNVLGVDGAEGAANNFLVPGKFRKVDYQDGPALSEFEEFDFCWSCEFVEHVYEEYAHNFMKDFSRAKYLAITHAQPNQGGYHHVNLKPSSYWIELADQYGFDYDDAETKHLQQLAAEPGKLKYFVQNGLFFVRR